MYSVCSSLIFSPVSRSGVSFKDVQHIVTPVGSSHSSHGWREHIIATLSDLHLVARVGSVTNKGLLSIASFKSSVMLLNSWKLSRLKAMTMPSSRGRRKVVRAWKIESYPALERAGCQKVGKSSTSWRQRTSADRLNISTSKDERRVNQVVAEEEVDTKVLADDWHNVL